MNKCQEVLGRLLVPGGNTSVLLQLVLEALDQVPVLIALPVILPLPLAVRQRWDHRLRTSRLDRIHQRFTVVRLVGDYHLGRQPLKQLLGLAHVSRLTRRQEDLDGKPEPADGTMDLGRESASAPPQGLIGWAPAAIRFFSTAVNTARTGSISAFQLDQQFGSFGFGSGLSHDFAPVHRLALAFGHACRTIR